MVAQERAAVLLLCALVLTSVGIVSWNSTQTTVLVSSTVIASEEAKLQTIEDRMMGASSSKVLSQAKKATKLQELINKQKKMLSLSAVRSAQPVVTHPARVQTLAYQTKLPTLAYHPQKPVVIGLPHKVNPLKEAGEAPEGLDETQQAEVAAQEQAAALARNLAAARAGQAAREPVQPTRQAAELAKHLHSENKQVVGWGLHPSAAYAKKLAAMHAAPQAAAHLAPRAPVHAKAQKPSSSEWDTATPNVVPKRAKAAGKAAKAPPGFVAVHALMPGQALPKGAVTLPPSFMKKLESKGTFVPKTA